MDLNHRRLIEEIERSRHIEVIDINELKIVNLSNYQVILIDELNGSLNRCDLRIMQKSEKTLVGKFYEDVISLNKNTLENEEVDFLIFRYKCSMSEDIHPSIKHYYIRHHFDLNIYKDYKLPKVYDVIIYGSIKKYAYPFRNRVAKLLLSNKHKFVVKHIRHPGYDQTWMQRLVRTVTFKKIIRMEQLSMVINQSHLCLCTPSSCDHLLSKYGESVLSHACVLGRIPTEAKQLFQKNYVHIDDSMSDERILKIICDALKEKEILAKNADITAQKYKSQLNIVDYPERLYNLCQRAYKSNK